MNDLRFMLLHDEARLPSRGHEDDAGLDLYVSEPVRIEPGTFMDVPCGVAVELPEDTWGLLVGRSSTLRKHRLMVHMGVIDQGYRGELFIACWNLGREAVEVEVGWRLGQLIILPNATRKYEPHHAITLTQSSRGVDGFGSTGV